MTGSIKAGEVFAEFKGDETDLKQATREAAKDLEAVDKAAAHLGQTNDKTSSTSKRLQAALSNTASHASGTTRSTVALKDSANAADEKLGHLGTTIGALASNARSGGTDIGSLSGAAGNLARAFALGGPLLLGVAALGGGLAVMITKMIEAKRVTKELEQAQEDLNAELAANRTASMQARLDSVIGQNLQTVSTLTGDAFHADRLKEEESLRRIAGIRKEIAKIEKDDQHVRRVANESILRSERVAAKERLAAHAERIANLKEESLTIGIEISNTREISKQLSAQLEIQKVLRAQLERQARIEARRAEWRRKHLAMLREEREVARALAVDLEDAAKKVAGVLSGAFGDPQMMAGLRAMAGGATGLAAAPLTDAAFMSTFVNPNEGVFSIDEFERPLLRVGDVLTTTEKTLTDFERSLDDVTTRGLDNFMAMLSDGSLLADVAAGRGAETAGGELGALAGGVIGSLFGGAAIGEAIGGVLGGLLGETLDEFIEALGVLAPLLGSFAVIIEALGPILLVLREASEILGRTIENMAPLIHELAKPFAALLVVVLRVLEALLPMVDFAVIVLTSFAHILEVVTLGVAFFDELFRSLINVAVTAIIGLAAVHDLVIQSIRDKTGFQNFGSTFDLEAEDYVANDVIGQFDGDYGDNTDALDDNTRAVREFSRSLTNIPSGYRVPLAEYRAETPNGNGGPTFLGPVTVVLSNEAAQPMVDRARAHGLVFAGKGFARGGN